VPLQGVFAVDVTVCSKCGGRMKVLEVVKGEPLPLHGGAPPLNRPALVSAPCPSQ